MGEQGDSQAGDEDHGLLAGGLRLTGFAYRVENRTQ